MATVALYELTGSSYQFQRALPVAAPTVSRLKREINSMENSRCLRPLK